MDSTVNIFLSIQCHKSEQLRDYTLPGKSLIEIKSAIAGNWQVKRQHYTICPFLPPCFTIDTIYRNDNGDRFTFFVNNDHIRNTDASGVSVRFDESPTVTTIRYSSVIDSVYVFRITSVTGSHQYLMKEIRQDTLIMEDYGVSYYLTPKP